MKRALLFCALSLGVWSTRVQAQVVTYSFTGATGSEATFPADAPPANAVAAPFSRGVGLTASNNAGTFSATGFTTDATIDLTDYFEFSVTPNGGFELDLTGLTFDERRSPSGYGTIEVRSSVDNFAAALLTANVPDDADTRNQSVPLSTAAFSDLASMVTFRIYGYGAEGAGGSGRIDNVVLDGVVASTGGVPTENVSVSFDPTSATVAEGGTAATAVLLTIQNEQGGNGLDGPVSGTITVSSGNGSQVQSFTTLFSFTAGSATGATVPVSITAADDNVFTGQRTVTFQLSGVTGATASATPFTLTITDDETAPPPPDVVINELDPDQAGSDTAEFVELLGPPNTPLAGLVLVFFNGANDQSYRTIDLDGQSTDASGLFVVGTPAVTPSPALNFPNGILQNGEDGVAVYAAPASSFPSGTAPTTAGLVDAVVYGNGPARASGLLAGFGQPATYQFSENYGRMDEAQSLARLNVPAQSGVSPSALFYVQTPSPGAANAATVTVDATAGVDKSAGEGGDAGWRLLGVPVVQPTQAPYAVGSLAPINLVQGIEAGTSNGAQYPQAPGPNVLTTYSAGTTPPPFLRPSSTDVGLPPAAGFFWYFYDQNIPLANIPPVFGPGTSQSFELTDPAFALSLTGVAVDDRLSPTPGTPYGAAVSVSSDGLYMTANPFAYPVLLSAIQTSSGTIGSNFSVFDAVAGSYITLAATDVVSPWQGVFAEVNGASGSTITLSASSTNVVPTSDVTLVGRAASDRLSFRLDGTLASGAAVADYASAVRFVADATTGWDRHDGSKLLPPQADQALVAFVGSRDGRAVRQATLALPFESDASATLVFRASGAGSFALTWDVAGLPAGVSASLRDLTTGTLVDLRQSDRYAFESDATNWSDRFEFVVGRNAVAAGAAPVAFELSAPAPNPSAAEARLALRVDAAQRVTATVVDALGRTVATVFDGALSAGAEQALVVPTARLAPGVYVIRVVGETFAQSRRLTVAR